MPTSKVYFTVSGQPAAVGGEVTFITKYITQSVTHLPRYTSQRHHPEQVDVATRVCRLDVAQPVPTQPAEVHGWTASSEWTRDGLQNNTQTHQNNTQTHGHAMAYRTTHKHMDTLWPAEKEKKHIRTTHKHMDTRWPAEQHTNTSEQHTNTLTRRVS